MVGIHKIRNSFYKILCSEYEKIVDEKPKLGYEFQLLDVSQRITPMHVLKLENCTDVSIDSCGLYGCGTLGVQAQNCSRLTVVDSNIYECSYGAVDVHQCQDVVVSGCDIHHHGTREGQGEAMNIFSVSYGEGFTVYNCRIHDNRAQYLLNTSFTKNTLFLSNEVLSNAFGAKVFTFQQYGATVDGCRFEGNDVSRGWYSGSGIYAADINGNALEGAERTL